MMSDLPHTVWRRKGSGKGSADGSPQSGEDESVRLNEEALRKLRARIAAKGMTVEDVFNGADEESDNQEHGDDRQP